MFDRTRFKRYRKKTNFTKGGKGQETVGKKEKKKKTLKAIILTQASLLPTPTL